MNFDRAWEQLEELQYDRQSSPYSFNHKFRCQYAVIETNFPKEKYPTRDQTIKRKLCHGLPPEARVKLEAF